MTPFVFEKYPRHSILLIKEWCKVKLNFLGIYLDSFWFPCSDVKEAKKKPQYGWSIELNKSIAYHINSEIVGPCFVKLI